ncbi:MAG: hypothetical protein R3E86_15875 [Pseudomonadales bacterium]
MNVKRSLRILVVAGLLGSALLSGADDWAAGPRNEIAVYQGSARLVQFGDLVDCSQFAPQSLVLQTRLVFVALPGVCDDLDERPCAGRLVAQLERCSAGGNASLAMGGLAGGYSRSPVAICFEPDAGVAAACNGANAVAEGTWVGAGWAAGADTELRASARLQVSRSRWFRLDGGWARVPLGGSAQQFTQERPSPGPGSCLASTGPGCAIIGVGQR